MGAFRFVHWARRGLWENLFRELAASGRSTDTQMIDSTHVEAHRSASGGKEGRKKQAVGRSRGERNTKIHAIADAKVYYPELDLTIGACRAVGFCCPTLLRLRSSSPSRSASYQGRSASASQSRMCEFPRIRFKHLPACRVSSAWICVQDGTSGGREGGLCVDVNRSYEKFCCLFN
jgi:hypothetical protein